MVALLGLGRALVLILSVLSFMLSQFAIMYTVHRYGGSGARWWGYSWYRFLADPTYITEQGRTLRIAAIVLQGIGIVGVLGVLVAVTSGMNPPLD